MLAKNDPTYHYANRLGKKRNYSRREGAMTDVEHRHILEDAEIERIVLLEIEPVVGRLSDGNKNNLKNMKIPELRQLAASFGELQGYLENMKKIWQAINDSECVRRDEQHRADFS
jgi:hypothetical protein